MSKINTKQSTKALSICSSVEIVITIMKTTNKKRLAIIREILHEDCTPFIPMSQRIVRHYGHSAEDTMKTIALRHTNSNFFSKEFIGINAYFFVKYALQLDAFGDEIIITKREFSQIY